MQKLTQKRDREKGKNWHKEKKSSRKNAKSDWMRIPTTKQYQNCQLLCGRYEQVDFETSGCLTNTPKACTRINSLHACMQDDQVPWSLLVRPYKTSATRLTRQICSGWLLRGCLKATTVCIFAAFGIRETASIFLSPLSRQVGQSLLPIDLRQWACRFTFPSPGMGLLVPRLRQVDRLGFLVLVEAALRRTAAFLRWISLPGSDPLQVFPSERITRCLGVDSCQLLGRWG